MVKDKKKKLILLDAHAIIHRAYHALPDFTSNKGEPTGALYGLSLMLIKIIKEFSPDYIIACYDLPKPTFRHDIYKEYKAKRPKVDDTLVNQLITSREVFESFSIPIYEKEGFEADDIIGTIADSIKRNDTKVIIASGDMDTLQLVDKDKVVVYTLKKGIKDTIIYNENAVKDRFSFGPKLLPDYKGLRGDPSDNIVGIAGIGDKSATDLISKFGSIEEIYKKLKKDKKSFEKAGIKERIINLLLEGEEEALFSKTLAEIRKDAPINFLLPKKTFLDSIDVGKVKEVFNKYGFKSLINNLSQIFPNNVDTEEKKEDENIDGKDIEKTAIALWLVDSNITNPDISDIYGYTGKTKFKEAKEIIYKKLKKDGLTKLYEEVELPLIPILKKVEERGIRIDKNYLADLSKKYHKELKKLEDAIYKDAGCKFNVNSPMQLQEVLFDKLKISSKKLRKTERTGSRSTRAVELEKVKNEHKIIPKILSYREFQKLLSTYIDNIPDMLDKNDRLHSRLVQTGTSTGRFSSLNPNLQNIPIKTELGRSIRNAFVPEKNFEFLSFDYSQIELRIAALLSGDKKLTKIFKAGHDVHTATAAEVFGVSFDNVDREKRRIAKIINFGILYGMGINALKQNIGGTREEAQKFYNSYFSSFSGLARYLDEIKKKAKDKSFTETFFGRRRYYPNINSHIPFIRAQEERMAINAPLQGTSADIIKKAMIEVDHTLINKKLNDKAYLLLQIHDELVYEVKKDKINTIAFLIKSKMEGVMKEEINFSVSVNIGKNLGEMRSFKNL